MYELSIAYLKSEVDYRADRLASEVRSRRREEKSRLRRWYAHGDLTR